VMTTLGGLLLDSGRLDAAEEVLGLAVDLAPSFVPALFSRGRVLQDLKRATEAEALYRRCVEAAPDFAEAWNNLGNILREDYRLTEACDCFRQAIAARPDFAYAHYHLGVALGLAGDATGALDSLDRALTLAPDLVDARYIGAQIRMSFGDFTRGLIDYESRRQIPRVGANRQYREPEWDGAPGRSVLVWAEQGVGDHLLYAGLLSLAAERTELAAVEIDRRLLPMLSRTHPGLPFIPSGEASPRPFTHQVPLANLMRRLSPWPQGFAPRRRTLEPAPARVVEARRWLDSIGSGPKIGISWRSAAERSGKYKSVPLDLWGPILQRRGVHFINLQYGDTESETADAARRFGATIHAMPGLDRFKDLEGLAALIDALDLTITTSNVAAHLAGALGKETWLILLKATHWYWAEALAPRNDPRGTLFYPSLRTYRQAEVGDWAPVVAAVAADLDARP
jgi:hypothetical protein